MTSIGPRGGAFIGRGWHFPVQPAPSGGVAMVTGYADIDQAIFLILSTHPGERPMRPEFGTPLADFVFEPINDNMLGRLADVVHRSLQRWEPRIRVDDVNAEPHPHEESTVVIDVSYRIRGDYDQRNLLVPFYVVPEEGHA